jgi:pimeloyl-ACP methyl ester carboxylesterase
MLNPISNLTSAHANLIQQSIEYWTDAAQRSALYLDTMRKRGNIYIEHALQGKPALLKFKHELLIDGKQLERPCNYSLLRILPDEQSAPRQDQRPVVIVDPRAGHGPGIGGFKPDSQVGVALRAGHPVYFVTFSPDPVEGQLLADIAHAEALFIEEVQRRHPASGRPAVIGNCQAGWAVAALASLRPEIMGPIVLNGAPLSYWAGSAKQNPMRYSGGVLGGSWMAALASDLGAGQFDGAHLVKNFENGNPANTYWSKDYNLYSKIDTEEARFLEFERWWGGHFRMTGEEIEGIVNNLFVGNKLARGEVVRGDQRIDLRNITSPVVVFASWGDDITPPQQALNWIVDVWGDEKAIVAAGRTIVYMLHEKIGHLGIFVGAGVARKEHDQIVNTLEMIERLPPGLYEMVIDEKTGTERYAELEHGDYTVHFELRKMDDILALDPDGREDEAIFSTIAKVSVWNEAFYKSFCRPFVRAMISKPVAGALAAMSETRTQRLMFSDVNPFMNVVRNWADLARANRKPVSRDNYLVALERRTSDQIVHALEAYGHGRDDAIVKWVEFVYGPLGLGAVFPPDAPAEVAARARAATDVEEARRQIAPLIHAGGFPEALARILIGTVRARGSIERRSGAIGTHVRSYLKEHRNQLQLGSLVGAEPIDWAAVLKAQTRIVMLEPQRAIEAIPALIPGLEQRELAVVIAAKILMLEPELGDADSKAARRVQELLGVDFNAAAEKLGVATLPRAAPKTGHAAKAGKERRHG